MMERLASAAAIAVRHAGAYTELILSDLEAASRMLSRRAITASIMVSSILLAVVMACLWAIAASWDTGARVWVMVGLLGVFLVIGAGACWRLTLSARGPGMLSQTAREWAKDRRLLEELLARERAQI